VEDLVADGYDAVYAAWPSSPTLQAIWRRNALGPGYPSGFEHISFLTFDELQKIVRALRLRAGDRVIDLACGAGGPGLFVARRERARLVGIDFSRVGIRLAAQRAIDEAVEADFVVAEASATAVADARAQGVLSVDALQYLPDKRAALREVGRVLAPGGRLAFAAFELDPERVATLPVLGTDPVADYAPLLDEVGFNVESYDETPHWEDRLEATYRAVVTAQDALAVEMGQRALGALLMEVSLTLEVKPYRRRVFVVASKRAERTGPDPRGSASARS
jgi:ubiquinone/menaquinone biosynthesis C-methylase UbiE